MQKFGGRDYVDFRIELPAKVSSIRRVLSISSSSDGS